MRKPLFSLVLWALFTASVCAQIPISGYNHVALSVKDIKVSARFYREVVGLEPIAVPDNLKEIRAWFKIAPGQELHLLAGRKDSVSNNDRNGAHFALTIPDANPIEQYLIKAGLPYHRQQRFDKAWQIYITDPDGYVIELNEPKVSPFSKDSALVLPLWANGAPGFEARKNEPEQAQDWWVKNIHNPSINVFLPPKEKATGTAVLICPGGGHKALVFNSEGVEAARYFNSIGVAAVVLKYRLFREENAPYKEENTKQDVFRAMRLLRSHATDWNIDPTKIGVMGFSAGGELAAWLAFENRPANMNSADMVEHFSARPDFLVCIYPGPLAVPTSLDGSAPPAFLLAANDDECCSDPVLKLLQLYRAAKVPAEAHLYAQGNHAFNMGNRSNLTTIKTWSQRLTDWMADSKLLDKK